MATLTNMTCHWCNTPIYNEPVESVTHVGTQFFHRWTELRDPSNGLPRVQFCYAEYLQWFNEAVGGSHG